MSNDFGPDTTAAQVVATYPERVQGRVFLITGPSPSSIGETTILALAAERPSKFILVGRNPGKYTPVVDAVKKINAEVPVRVYGIDLSSIASVRDGASKIISENDRIDVLINNAGVMGGPLAKTNDGIEERFATNHIGHFLLTNLLMPLLLKGDEPRIINVSSMAHMSGTGDYSDLNFEKTPYSWHAAYGQSKLANIHFTYALAKKLGARGVASFSVHPGTIFQTNIFAALEPAEDAELRGFVSATGAAIKTLEQGAATTVFAALGPDLGREHNGAYLSDCHISETTGPGARLPDAPENLWRLSETLVGETFAY